MDTTAKGYGLCWVAEHCFHFVSSYPSITCSLKFTNIYKVKTNVSKYSTFNNSSDNTQITFEPYSKSALNSEFSHVPTEGIG